VNNVDCYSSGGYYSNNGNSGNRKWMIATPTAIPSTLATVATSNCMTGPPMVKHTSEYTYRYGDINKYMNNTKGNGKG
jgi:hypothetical protein